MDLLSGSGPSRDCDSKVSGQPPKGVPGDNNIPTLNKEFEILAPEDICIGLVFQLGDGLADDVGKEVDKASPGLHLGAIGGEGKSVLSNLEKCDTRRPDVGCDGVRLASNTLRCHVVAGADERVGLALCTEITRHTKVAELDVSIPAEQDVAGLDVTVDDLFAVQIRQAVQHTLGHLPQHLLASTTAKLLHFLVDAVERPSLAELHGDRDGSRRGVRESTIVPADVF